MTTQEAIKYLEETKIGCDFIKDRQLLDVCNIAISALQKQLPRKCKHFRDICSCGTEVYPHMNYCRSCGQALNWSKENGD